MESWLKVSLLLCAFGFFRDNRPSDPFMFEYLTGGWHNVTETQLIEVVYPLGAYFNFGLLLVIFLITDILRYKPVIVVSALSGVGLYISLLFYTSLIGLVISQFFYGLFLATEVAYYSYIYAKVERKHYQQVTSNSRSAILAGKFIGSVLGQGLIYFDLMNTRDLNYIALSNQIISLAVGILLPSANKSLYFYTSQDDNNKIKAFALENRSPYSIIKKSEDIEEWTTISSASHLEKVKKQCNVENKRGFSCRNGINLLWNHLKAGYSNKTVFLWSIWWTMAMSGFLMVWGYIQPLWRFISPDRDNLWNGAAEALHTLFGALSAMAAALINQETVEKWDIWILSVCSVIQAVVTLIAAFSTNVFIAYVMYIAFGTLYHFMLTITSAIIAKFLAEDSFALIFGINTLLALFLQVNLNNLWFLVDFSW